METLRDTVAILARKGYNGWFTTNGMEPKLLEESLSNYVKQQYNPTDFKDIKLFTFLEDKGEKKDFITASFALKHNGEVGEDFKLDITGMKISFKNRYYHLLQGVNLEDLSTRTIPELPDAVKLVRSSFKERLNPKLKKRNSFRL
ncbi:hypothetical protein OK18_00565 [Chryseobacterium gallinarum]|uniref:Uncharacterized protein n=1 Tax=Chryseobacterium gallinarum TaxID=1324352 RepID=A0A0G3M2T2_CHRGL|nr:hypothetical protein [Chryseobacterium gallinarum]AKK71327.1 hypothetical protein OK18_00565 [Chryseobacterium gallinarum]